MFEGWAADVLASYLGKYLDLPRDRLRISLWGGEGILEDVQLRVEAFEYLQLPFAIKEGSVGRLKLQIPWGRWRGGPLVVELSDVVLCVAPREESDWEEGPALRRAQASKQAQLAAAELAKLGSRVAATGSSTGAKPAAAPSTAAGTGTSWGLAIADYVLSFLLNRLQFAIKNIHVYFQAPDNCSSEYDAFGVKLASLSTVAAGDAPSVLSLFPALQSASAAATAAAKIIRQLHVQGWSCYWKPRRQQQPPQQQQGPAQAPHGPAAGNSHQHKKRQAHRHSAPKVESQDYLLAPVEAVLQVSVHTSGVGSVSAGGSGSSAGAGAGVLSSGLACDVFLGAGQVSMQLSSQQLVGMARLADDAAIWSKRARYGCFRPPGWITAHQAAQQGLCWHESWHEGRSAVQHLQQQQDELDAGAAQLSRTVSGSSSSSVGTGVEDLRSSSFSSAAGSCLVPTGRNGVGAPVAWRAVWRYAVQSVLADVRDRRRQQGCWSVQKNDLLARRRYVHLYQQKLDALQPTAVVPAEGSTDSTAESKAEGAAAAAGAAAVDSSSSEGSAALQSELQRLEQQLCVADILLCRSLAELALERRSSSSEAERCRSWFAWGASSISGYLYPSAQQASSNSTTAPSKATPSKQGVSSGGAGATMPSAADLDELLEILHIRNSRVSDTGGVPAPSEEAAAALEAAQQAAGSRAAPDSKPSGLATTAVIALKWQVLRLRAALQDCPAVGPKQELLVLDLEGTSITGNLKGGNLSAQLALQDVRLFDCCSDPGVHECVLQRLDPASPVAAVGGQLLSPSRGWGSGLTGLALSQAQGLQRMSPEAFGWSSNAMPAVASGAHMRHAAGAPGGVSGASSAGRGLMPPLLTIGLEVAGSSKHVRLKLEPLQVLARPGCVVAVNSMLEQLPHDTLQQQLAAVLADVESAPGYAAGQLSPAPVAAAPAPRPRTVRFSDASQAQQQPSRKAAPVTQQQQLPPELLQLQLTFVVSELLLVLPTELQYASGTNVVLHLQGLRLAAAQAATPGIPLGAQTRPGEQLQYELSSSSTSSSGETGSDKPQQLPQQQQLALELSSLFLGVHQSYTPETVSHSFDAVPEHMYSQRQAMLQEVLKLPPIQGTVWLTGSKQPAPAQRRCSNEATSRQAPVKVSLQVPPVSCCLSASLLATLQQAAAAVEWQSQLSLPGHVATYNLPLQQQLELAAESKQQPQQQQYIYAVPPADMASAAAGAADVNSVSVAAAGSRTPSPTESEVAQWLAAPASTAPAGDAGDVAATSTLQLLRCDSDKLLQPAAALQRHQPHAGLSQQTTGRGRRKHKMQKQQLTQADAAANLALPEVLLLDLEVLLEELDIQYVHDVGADKHPRQQNVQQAQQQATSPHAGHSNPSTAAIHVRLQASLLSVGFKHSTHGSRVEAGLKDLVLQDVLADAAVGQHGSAADAGGLPGLLQLISSVSVEELQVAWSRQLSQLAVLQEVQVALEGLQVQGQPGDVGLSLLPAAADAGSSITAAVRTSSPHPAASISSSAGSSKGHSPAAASTYVAVGVQNLALGIDGLLHIAAALAGPKDRPHDSGSHAGQTPAPAQQQRDVPTGNKPALTLELQLSQIQLLSCSSTVQGDEHNTRWQTADSFTQQWQPLQDAAALTPQGVVCELLLDLPTASFSLQPGKHMHPLQPQQQAMPRLLLQDLAVYLPGAPQADVLLPVLHIPRVLFAGGPEVQQEQEQPGLAAVLQQQAECHRLCVPAVATSLRPPQLQHLVQFAERQEQQWQVWTAKAASADAGSSDHDSMQHEHDRQPVQGAGEVSAHVGLQAKAQQQQSLLSVEVGDVQVLLLPADGTSDKGLLLHWQQLAAAVLKHPKQPHQAASTVEPAAGQGAAGDVDQALLQRTQVSWHDLTVSAVQQDDMQPHWEPQTQQHLAPDGPEKLEPSPNQHSKLAGLQQAAYHAHELPAVAWLSQGLGGAGSQQQGTSTRRRQSAHAQGAAGYAAGPQPNGIALNRHATLSRFLSSQESWRDAASLPASVDSGTGFFTPKGSASLRSTGSWLSARSSSLSAALSLQPQQQRQPPPQPQPQAAPPGGAAAAAAAAVGPGNNIIAAWWQAEPPGQSPPGVSPAWLQAASSVNAVLPGWGSLPHGASPLGGNPADAGQQQQLGGRSPPRKGVRRSSSFRRGIPAGALQLVGRSGQQGAASVRSSLNLPVGAAGAISVHSLGLDDGMTDADVEFYSIAGDSDDDADNLSAVGSPHGLDGGLDAAEEDATWLRCWDLLPLAGFDSQGCHVAASWLLLSLSTADTAETVSAAPAVAERTQQPALLFDMWRDVIRPGGAAIAGTSHLCSGQTSRQVTAVTSEGLQLQLSSRHWDLVAACILQAVNAAKPARPTTLPKEHAEHREQAVQPPSQQPQAFLSQLHVGLQALHVVLFVAPDIAEAPMQPRTVVMRSSSGRGGRPGSSSAAHDLQSGRSSSGAFAPWQDPGSEPTTPTAVAGMQAQHPMLPAAAACGSQAAFPAAQTVVLKLSAELDLVLPANGQPCRLQQVGIPTASVQLGAAPWDTTAGRLLTMSAEARPSAQQQEQLLLLLARGIHVVAGTATGAAEGKLGPFTAVTSPSSSAQVGQRLQVGVSSISGWVSTTRLSLLLNIQQQLMQQLPALTAAAAMAGPSYSAHAAGYAGGGPARPVPINRSDITSAASLTTSASLMNGYAATSSSMRRRSMDQQALAGKRLVLDSSIDVCVRTFAILVSTDEPEPWLLQQQQQQPSPRRAGSSASSPDRGLGLGMQADAAGSVSSPGMGTGFGGLAAPTGYAPLSTCSTPLIEVALLPLEVKLQLLKPCGLRKGAAGQSVVQVGVSARVRCDVYSVDKLGWEPVLDPWALKADLRLTPSAPAGSGASSTHVSASVSSSEVLELTAAPSCIIASKQLQALVAAAKTWQGEHALMQQLLHHLSAPAAGSCLSSAGASCWLANETGVPLSYIVADTVMKPTAAAAALSTCSSSASSVAGSPIKPLPPSTAAARAAASARGQAAHLTPVPLRVLDVAAAGYSGRFVEQGGVTDAAFKLQPLQPGQVASAASASANAVPAAGGAADAQAAGSGAGGSSTGVKQFQLLYVQAAGRADVVGPVALSQMGCSVYPLKGLAAGAVLSPGSTPGHSSRRSRQASSSLVVDVARHLYGGRLVSAHSNIQLVNNSGLALQLGHVSPMGLSAQPLPLALLAPGDAVWLPLQVLQATVPSLCVKPAGLPCSYSWCKALDVYGLLPDSSSTAAATSGFWYEPAGSAAAPRATSQFLRFAPEPADSDVASGQQVSRILQHGEASATAAAAAAAVGNLVLAVGASARPWPAGVAVHDAASAGASHGGSVFSRSSRVTAGGQTSSAGSSAASTLWQLVVEPPAVLVNQLPVSVEVSVVAGKGEVRGLAALIDSRQELPLYGCEAAYYSKLRVQVPGFHSSSWIPLNTAVSSSSDRAAMRHVSDPGTALRHSSTGGPADGPAGAASGARYSDAGGALRPDADSSEASVAAVPDALQLLDQRQVVLSGLQAHQPPQVLQLRTCRNKLTGALTITVSCSLWIFNCLGSQIAMRQAGTAADAAGTVSTLPGAGSPQAAAKLGGDMEGSSSSSQVLWLPPYPWMSRAQGSGSSSDLVGLGAAAAGTSSQGPASLASAWAAARRSDASNGASSRSVLQRSRSTPSLVASMAGLEFLAVTPAPVHTPAARGTAPASAPRSTGLSAYQRRASRAEQQQHETASWAARTQGAQAGPVGVSPFAVAAGVASLVSSSGPTAGAAAVPFVQQHSVHRPLDQQPPLAVRRSFSASAQIQVSSAGSVELPADSADTAQSAVQKGAEDAAWQQQHVAAGDAYVSGQPPRAPRTRRHSSGLHMLASGKLPQQLLPQLQAPDSAAAPPAGCSSFDMLSPTHQQRLLQQMHFQQAAAMTGSAAQIPQSASASNLVPGDGCQAVVLPLMKPDMNGWLPLLAGGDLNQLTAAAAAFSGPVNTAEVIVAPAPGSSVLTAAAASQAAMQQRVAAAAAAADQLLADMPRAQHHAQHYPEQAPRGVGSPPTSVSRLSVSQVDGLQHGRPPSMSGYSQYSQHSHCGHPYGQQYSQYSASAAGAHVHPVSSPGLAGLAAQSHQGAATSTYQPQHAPSSIMRRPSGSWSGAGFADLAAAAAASHVAASSSEAGHRGLPGSVGGGLSAVPPGYAASYRSTAVVDAASTTFSSAAAAVPVMCGWPVHMFDGSSSSVAAASKLGAAGPAVAAAANSACGFVELQLCAAPAAVAAAMVGKGVQQLPEQWSLPTRVPLLGSQASPGPCSIVKLPLSVPASATAATGQPTVSAGTATTALGGMGGAGSAAPSNTAATGSRRKAGTRGKAAGAAAQQEQGACFVSVHTAAIPGGGRAWAVHLLPTYVLVNTLATEVQLRQCDSELVLQTVPPGGHCCVLWPNAALPLKLQFRVDEAGWSWSGAASVDAPGEFLVKIRHRSRGETLLLQLDVAASSSGIVAMLSGRQGGFAPYRIDNCSAEVLHVQQAGCAEQEDVLRPYSSLPYAWDEPSMPHKVLLFLRGHRPLGEFALEKVGQVRRVAIPSSSRDHLSRSHAKRLLLITTYAEGPMRVLRVLDTQSHLLQQPAPPVAVVAQALPASGVSLEAFSSRGSFASITDTGLTGYASSNGLSQQQQGLSRPSSTSSLQGAAASSSSGQVRTPPAASAAAAHAAGASAAQQLNARNRTLRLLSAFLAPSDSNSSTAAESTAASSVSIYSSLGASSVGNNLGSSAMGALKIAAPSLDVRVSLDGCGLSLVSDTRELLYSSVRGVKLRFCQDPLRNAVGAAIASMRVENTLYGCQYPLMLASPVSRSVFGVVYPPGPQGPSTAAGLPAAAADIPESAEDADAEAEAVSGSSPASTSEPDAAVTAAVAAAAAAAADVAGLDASSIAHAVADELQQQEHVVHAQQGAPKQPAAAAPVAKQPSRSNSQRFRPQQQQAQQQQQQQLPAMQLLQPHHLALGVLATVWRTQPSGVVCVEQLGLHLSPLALSLEGKHLKQLMEFGAQVAAAAAGASEGQTQPLVPKGRGQSGQPVLGAHNSTSNCAAGVVHASALQHSWPPVQPPSLPAAATTAVSKRLKLYFEEWFVSAITLCISFAPGSWFDPSPAGLASVWSGANSAAAAAAVAAEAAAAAAAAAQAASEAATGAAGAPAGAAGHSSRAGVHGQEADAAGRDSATPERGADAVEHDSGTVGSQQESAAAADVGAAAAAVAAASSSPLPVYLQMALALAHAEEGAWLTLAPFSSTHIMINTESLVQVLGRHYILAAYQELPKVLASLDIFGDPARLLQALGLGFWNLVTLPAHSARWGPYRSLQRLLRGMRVMAYGVSNSIAKGSKRSKAALLPLAPDGLSWQQQQQPTGGGWGGASNSSSSSMALYRPGLESGSLAALRSGSIRSPADAAAISGSNQPGSGQDLLHVLVAGYSLTFQHLLRSFQSGQPLRGVVRAAAQALVLPALLLLETSESTASSFVRLLAEQVPGAVALRVPRYVASGQLLRPYDRMESLGRALLHHTPGPFLREEFMGCMELQQGLYAVVTVGHLLLLACRTTPAAGSMSPSAPSNTSTSSKGSGAAAQSAGQLHSQQEDLAGSAASEQADQQQHQQQQRTGCVQYKDPQMLFVLDLRDVMMVAAEGSNLRLLCMAGDPASATAVAGDSAAGQGGQAEAASSQVVGTGEDGGSSWTGDGTELVGREGSGSATGSGSKGGDGQVDAAASTSGLRELLPVAGVGSAIAGIGRLQQRLPATARAGSSVPTAAVAGVQAGVDRVGRWQALGSVVSMTDAELESAAAGAAAAVAAAAGGGLMGMPEGVQRMFVRPETEVEGEDSSAAAQAAWGGCKWFVGHQVPCGSDVAALQLQQLLERACQRVETLLASSAWPRQLML